MQHNNIPYDSSCKISYDYLLGAQLVYSRLAATTSELASRQRLILMLRKMLMGEIPDSSNAYSIKDLRIGWNSELKKLLSEFSFLYKSERRQRTRELKLLTARPNLKPEIECALRYQITKASNAVHSIRLCIINVLNYTLSGIKTLITRRYY